MSQTLGKGTSVGNSQMEWLYDSSSGKPTNDDYLMGKAVDKNFERMGTEGQINAVEYDCCPESIFSSQVDHQVDLQRKLQEDPLVSLRKKEVDTRKKILDNPLKLREITSYIDSIKRKKHKKEKKRKKHKRQKDSKEDDEKDLDQILLQKLKGMTEGAPSNSSSNKEHREDTKSSKHLRRDVTSSDSSKSSPDNRRKYDKKRQREDYNHHSQGNRLKTNKFHKEKSSSPSRYSKHGNRPKSESRNKHSEIKTSYYKSSARDSFSNDSKEKRAHNSNTDESDRAKKLKEMMQNADWREEQRSNKVKKHREKESEEEAARISKHDPTFIRKELAKAADSGTVEKRIQSNRHNIQRGVSSMNENFARR